MPRILLIEDNYRLLRLHTRVLQNAGYDVYPAAAYYAALDMFRLYGQFSLCISDVEVGNYDPMLLMRDLNNIRKRHTTPMLLMSAQMENYQPMANMLHLPLLEKPFTNDILVAQVRELATVEMNASRVS